LVGVTEGETAGEDGEAVLGGVTVGEAVRRGWWRGLQPARPLGEE